MAEQTIINAILTQGGLAVLAVVLLYLHITGMKTASTQIDKMLSAFQGEQQFERKQCQEQFNAIMTELRNVSSTAATATATAASAAAAAATATAAAAAAAASAGK